MTLQHQINRLLTHRASEWHQLLENASDTERAEFVAWLKQSPLHVQEYLETVYTDQLLKHMDPERQENLDALLTQITPTVIPLSQAFATTAGPRRRPARWLVRVPAIAAVVALCAVLLTLSFKHNDPQPEYTTALGEQRTIQLADSSVITLNADSKIQLHVDQAHRGIELVRGEALFKVAHDSSRPFIVRTKTAVVTAVGTQFNVYERADGTQVSVLEGRVRVEPLDSDSSKGSSGGTQSLGAGQEAQVSPDGSIQLHAKADVMGTVAWRERRLVFDNAPLEEMVHEFNRYNRTPRLTLDGVPAGSHHYNGVFNAADPDSLADLLSKEADLSIERRDGEIIIRKR